MSLILWLFVLVFGFSFTSSSACFIVTLVLFCCDGESILRGFREGDSVGNVLLLNYFRTSEMYFSTQFEGLVM